MGIRLCYDWVLTQIIGKSWLSIVSTSFNDCLKHLLKSWINSIYLFKSVYNLMSWI